MFLQKLQLANFKNYETESVDFPSKINVLVGSNGSGKTNFLDAIYYLALTKSAFQSSDPSLIRQGESYFRLAGDFLREETPSTVVATYQTGSRKIIKEQDLEYQKMSDHIGKYPVVMIAPDDTEIIKGPAELRRRFFDSIISQIDRPYLEKLMQYNHLLKQRNSLLKIFHETGRVDHTALDTYDESMTSVGVPIYNKRSEFIGKFVKTFDRYFDFLVDSADQVGLFYKSGVDQKDFMKGLLENRKSDLISLRTQFGIHRDDYEFKLGEYEMKKFGSQGQQKSFIIALKLAMWETIRVYKGFKPILLLDDIFDKLDDIRISKLLNLIGSEFGQLFISDARPDRTAILLNNMKSQVSVFKVEAGKVKTL